jgi:hypothetical protein
LDKGSLPGRALEELARRRAGAIAAFLADEQGLAPDRRREQALVPSPLSPGPEG